MSKTILPTPSLIGRLKKMIFFGVGDILITAVSFLAAFLIRFDGHLPAEYLSRIPAYIGLAILITVPLFALQGLYTFTWKFVSIHEMLALSRAVGASALFYLAGFLLARDTSLFLGFPRSILIVHFGLIFILSSLLRFAKRIFYAVRDNPAHNKEAIRAMLIGADSAADHLLRIMAQGHQDYRVVGILDENQLKIGTYLHGIPVIGTIPELPTLAPLYGAQTIIIALSTAKPSVVRAVFNLARSVGISEVKIIPSFLELLSGTVAIQQLRPVKVEDILGRQQAKIDTTSIEQFLHGKDILITGAAGSIGSELARQISRFAPHALHLLDYEESNLFDSLRNLQAEYPDLNCRAILADIRNAEKMQTLFETIRPQIVFHAAAYKHVPLTEVFPEEAVNTNVFGTVSVARAAANTGVQKFVLISSDKAVRPISIMGQTKKLAEMVIQAFNNVGFTSFIAVRFGNVLGSRGSVLPIFEEQIRKGGPLTITDPRMTRFFMTTTEAVLLIAEAATLGKGGDIFMLDMGDPVKIVDLARELIRLNGFEPEKDIPLTYIGARPGEKIVEEVLTTEEGATLTRYQKVLRLKTSFSMRIEELLLALETLKRNFSNRDMLRAELARLTSSTPLTPPISPSIHSSEVLGNLADQTNVL